MTTPDKTESEVRQDIRDAYGEIVHEYPDFPPKAVDRTLHLLDIALESGMPLPSDVLGYDPDTGPPGIPLEWGPPEGFLIVTPHLLDGDTAYLWEDWGLLGTFEGSVLSEDGVVARFKEWRR